MLIGAILNIVLSIILGIVMGITGVILASAIARLSTYFWYEPKLLFKEYFETGAKEYFIGFLKNVLLVITIIVVLYIIFLKFSVTGWVTLIIKGAITDIVCCVVFMACYAKTEGFMVIWEKAVNIFKKLKK